MKALDLRPTQFVLGLREVDHKKNKMKDMDSHSLDKYLKKKTVPVIISADGVYLVDHHHLVRACIDNEIQEVYVDIISDMSDLEKHHFGNQMIEKNWVYRYDQFGNGPQDTKFLANDVRGLADDQYRSLAWAVCEAGGFLKTEIFYSEFKWANFFRDKVIFPPGKEGFDSAVARAMKLALSPEANHLPGHRKPKK